MTPAWIETDRNAAVRRAARGWKAAGAIDAAQTTAIEAAYPDPRARFHKAWRVLVFVLVTIGIVAAVAGVFSAVRAMTFVCGVCAAVLVAATEAIRRSRHSGSGSDAATAFWAVVFALGAAWGVVGEILHERDETVVTVLLACAAIVGAAAAWRWGFWFFAAFGAAAFYLLLARFSFARPVWIVVGILAMAAALPRLDRASIAPSHRFGLAAVFVASAAAVYAAVNLFSVDWLAVEHLRLSIPSGARLAGGASAWRIGAAVATAAFPVAFLVAGIRSRRRLLIGIGLAATALSVATLRHYAPIGPRWAWLTACGAIAIGAALWIHRRLRDAPGAAWRGLTAAPLYSGEGNLTPLGGLAAAISMPAGAEPADRHGFTGGGGEYGGGGASGQY